MTDTSESNARWADRISPQLNTLWRGRWKAAFVEPARYLYDHELVLVTEGSCVVQIEKTRHELTEGDYIIVPPDTYHVTTTPRGVHRHCIHFDWERTRPKAAHPLFRYAPERPERKAVRRCPAFVPRRAFTGSFASIPAMRPLLETLFHRWQTRRRIDQALARATLLEILILLLTPPERDARTHDLGREHAYVVRGLLDRNDHAGIQELLKSSGFSYPHLCRLFRATFGLTPVAYRNALRLERAKALLANSRLSIAEIAYEAGFKDPSYFTRQFRRQNKISPREARLAAQRG
jgi:AraC-like DNA-binding protein